MLEVRESKEKIKTAVINIRMQLQKYNDDN